jgi:hypothetical protein
VASWFCATCVPTMSALPRKRTWEARLLMSA